MQFDLDEALNILGRTPKVLRALLEDLPEQWVMKNEGPDTWSPFDVVGHLIHGEKTDWVPRTKIILLAEDKRFIPFDRFAMFEASKGKAMNELLDEFETLRTQSVEEFRQLNISDADLDKTGIHPEFGDVTLRELLAAHVTHDLGHIVQINRVLAKQYKNAAGPWPKYIAVLNS